MKIRIIKSLKESEENPEKNEKVNVTDLVGDPRVFFTMSNVRRFGLYPLSEYSTPIGIYCYPFDTEHFFALKRDELRSKYLKLKSEEEQEEFAKKYAFSVEEDPFSLSKKRTPRRLPFKGDAPLIHIFIADWDKILIFSKYTFDQFENDTAKLKAKYPYLPAAGSQIRSAIKDMVAASPFSHRQNVPAAHLWTLTRWIATTEAKERKDLPKKWASILSRDLEYDGAVDNGFSIIHRNEPTQTVFFPQNKKVNLELLHTIANGEDYKDKMTYLKQEKRRLEDILNDQRLKFSGLDDPLIKLVEFLHRRYDEGRVYDTPSDTNFSVFRNLGGKLFPGLSKEHRALTQLFEYIFGSKTHKNIISMRAVKAAIREKIIRLYKISKGENLSEAYQAEINALKNISEFLAEDGSDLDLSSFLGKAYKQVYKSFGSVPGTEVIIVGIINYKFREFSPASYKALGSMRLENRDDPQYVWSPSSELEWFGYRNLSKKQIKLLVRAFTAMQRQDQIAGMRADYKAIDIQISALGREPQFNIANIKIPDDLAIITPEIEKPGWSPPPDPGAETIIVKDGELLIKNYDVLQPESPEKFYAVLEETAEKKNGIMFQNPFTTKHAHAVLTAVGDTRKVEFSDCSLYLESFNIMCDHCHFIDSDVAGIDAIATKEFSFKFEKIYDFYFNATRIIAQSFFTMSVPANEPTDLSGIKIIQTNCKVYRFIGKQAFYLPQQLTCKKVEITLDNIPSSGKLSEHERCSLDTEQIRIFLQDEYLLHSAENLSGAHAIFSKIFIDIEDEIYTAIDKVWDSDYKEAFDKLFQNNETPGFNDIFSTLAKFIQEEKLIIPEKALSKSFCSIFLNASPKKYIEPSSIIFEYQAPSGVFDDGSAIDLLYFANRMMFGSPISLRKISTHIKNKYYTDDQTLSGDQNEN